MNAGARKALHVFVWTLATLVVLVLFVRAFVGDVFYVDSSSMEPVIHGAAEGGEYVFVRYDDDPRHERFDLAIIARPQDREPLVKRIAGLPGETVQLSGGDLFVDGARLVADEPRPPWIELFDSSRDELDQHFTLTNERWSRRGEDWRLEAREVRWASASWHGRLFDDYLAPDRAAVSGKRQVGDGALELEARVEEPWKRLVLRLTEEGDLFELELTPASAGAATARLWRRPVRAKSELLGEVELPFAAGVWHRLRLSNRDNHLEVDCDARRGALRVTYEANVALENMPDAGYRHLLPRVAFGGGGLAADFRGIKVSRDLHYTELGRHATQGSETLAPDEVFVLGDNSAESVDSREWGPVKLAHVIGRPLWVVWPPSRWRRLSAREEISAP